jgi:hypothetical protein
MSKGNRMTEEEKRIRSVYASGLEVRSIKDISEIERNREAIAELVQRGKAVVDRWDSPLWKDLPNTVVYIASLRAAITKHDTQPTTKEQQA